jgi:predicted metalloprotease
MGGFDMVQFSRSTGVSIKCGILLSIYLAWSGLVHAQEREPRGEKSRGSDSSLIDEIVVFVSKALATTEDVWRDKFRQAGKHYLDPKLVLFTGLTHTACGNGLAAMGPFYCPLDRKIYLDLSFFEDLKRQHSAPGAFAQAYVIAHEVGHHVQTLLGIEKHVSDLQSKMPEAEANRLNVRLELQADCLAGIWASSLPKLPGVTLEPNDIQQGLRATQALGDDMIQRRATGTVVLDSFTHGTGDQRSRWFKRGLDSGNLEQCNTFAAADL